MMNTYDVYIETDQQLKGIKIHHIQHARSHEEAMDLAMSFCGLTYGTLEQIIVIPRMSEQREDI
jgi:hypothetical protein